jgi:hypothetical protein
MVGGKRVGETADHGQTLHISAKTPSRWTPFSASHLLPSSARPRTQAQSWAPARCHTPVPCRRQYI